MEQAEEAAVAAKVELEAVEATAEVEDVLVGSVMVLFVSVLTMEEQEVQAVMVEKEVEERDITGMEIMP